MKEYQFPPQLGEKTLYFGYYAWQWGVLIFGGIGFTFLSITLKNASPLLPLVIFAMLAVKPKGTTSMLAVLLRSYNYFLAKPINYTYTFIDETEEN